VSARDTPLSYGALHDAVNWLSERDIGRDDEARGRQRVSRSRVVAELNPAGPAKCACHDGAQSSAVPDGHTRRGGKQGTQIESEENEAAAARPRHDQANGRARRLEPDAQRLQNPTERDQAGKGEG
jgi:hypothetical protein